MKADKEVSELLTESSRHVRSLAKALRDIVLEAVPDAEETVKNGWKTITYESDGVVCYIAPLTKHVDLGFYEGTKLKDPEKLLEGHGKKLRHIKVWDPKDIRPKEFKDLVKEAFRVHTK